MSTGFPRRLENLENEYGDGKVTEKSWNLYKDWPKVMEFCDQSWNFTNLAPNFYQICMNFATTKKLSSNLESPHFPIFSPKCRECKIGKRDSHGKSRNGHGKVMDMVHHSSLYQQAINQKCNRCGLESSLR